MSTTLLERPQADMTISRRAPILTAKPKYCLYARKSSEDDERQALSIDSQIKEMMAMATREGLEVAEIRRESHSAKESGARPVFKGLLEEIDQGLFTGILTWAPDRLSRNAGDLGKIVDLMDQGRLIDIRTHGQQFRNSPNEKFLLMILCSQAKLENDNRGVNVKRGLRAKCEKGARPGRVPLGYKLVRSSENFYEPSKVVVDQERAPYIKKIFQYALEGYSGRQIDDYMYDEGFRTTTGKRACLSMILRALKEPYYYGEFEYPVGSGSWYKGTHKPLITKETFMKVKALMKVCNKGEWGRKDFYFRRLFKCGVCGSGVSGEEHVKPNGKSYTYYKCNRFGGHNLCREKYIREDNLVESLASIIDAVKEKHETLARRLKDEIERFNQLQRLVNGNGQGKELSVKDYIEYVLRNGTNQEKSCLLRYIEGQLVLKGGVVEIR